MDGNSKMSTSFFLLSFPILLIFEELLIIPLFLRRRGGQTQGAWLETKGEPPEQPKEPTSILVRYKSQHNDANLFFIAGT